MQKYEIFVKQDFCPLANFYKKTRLITLNLMDIFMSEQTQNQTKKFFLGNMLAMAATVIWAGNFYCRQNSRQCLFRFGNELLAVAYRDDFCFSFCNETYEAGYSVYFQGMEINAFYGGIGCFSATCFFITHLIPLLLSI